MKRRQFILSLAGTAAAAGWGGWQLGSGQWRGSRLSASGIPEKFSRQSWALGTHVLLTVYHRDKAVAETALDAAFLELDRVEDVLSLYRPASEICRLNKTKHLDPAHPYLREVLQQAETLSAQTDGSFDITVQPLYRLHADKAAAGTQPTEAEILATLDRVGWQKVQMDGTAVRLEGRDTEITLNGIAQGFAADAVSRVLAEHGIAHALIDTGEIGTLGAHVQKDAWDIAIKHPRRERDYLALARLNGRCLATSGDYETRFGDGYQNHHILDPKTGFSPSELASVSVAAPTAMEADALSTALFLTGMRKGMRLIESIPGADALFVTKSGAMTSTSGFPVNS